MTAATKIEFPGTNYFTSFFFTDRQTYTVAYGVLDIFQVYL